MTTKRKDLDLRSRDVRRKRRGDDPILVSLRQADCIRYLADRVGGPKGIRSSLRDRSGGSGIQLSDEEIERAIAQCHSIKHIEDGVVRMIVTLMSDTLGCTCIRSIYEVAQIAGVPQSTARARLRSGLDILRQVFEQSERRAA